MLIICPYHEDGFITADDADSVYKFVNRASEEKYQVSRRFGNREPRFYASISFNGCVWESENAYKNQNGTVDIQNKPCNYYRGRKWENFQRTRILSFYGNRSV